MSLRWRVSRGHPPRWRYVGAMSKGMYVHIRERLPVSTEVEVDTMTSHTAGPNARGLSRRHADWRCTELGSWCRPGQLRASRLDQFADKAVKLAKRKASAALLPSVVMEGESLEPIYQFDYFECRFTSDGDDKADMPHCTAIVDERSRVVLTTCGATTAYTGHRSCASSQRALALPGLTHGSEAWTLNQLRATTPHHREVVCRGGHQAFVRRTF